MSFLLYLLACVIVAVSAAVLAAFVLGIVVALAVAALLVLVGAWIVEKLWNRYTTRQNADSAS